MPQSKQSDRARRAPRVKLAGTILALLQLENGRQIRARLHQLSFTGGLLHMDKPLDEGSDVSCSWQHRAQQSGNAVPYVGYPGLPAAL